MDTSVEARRNDNGDEGELSPLEQEVLDEYAKLAGNLDNVCYVYYNRSRSIATEQVPAFFYTGRACGQPFG